MVCDLDGVSAGVVASSPGVAWDEATGVVMYLFVVPACIVADQPRRPASTAVLILPSNTVILLRERTAATIISS